MKATGIVRQVDQLGRVVLPKEMRDNMGIGERDPLEIFVEGNDIILRQYKPGCQFCNETDHSKMTQLNGKFVCEKCVSKLNTQVSA